MSLSFPPVPSLKCSRAKASGGRNMYNKYNIYIIHITYVLLCINMYTYYIYIYQICIIAWPAGDSESLIATPFGEGKAKSVCESGGP